MGSGSWTSKSFSDYTVRTKGVTADNFVNCSLSAQDVYKSRRIDGCLNPFAVTRECRDSKEHPNTFPVILALDVTGSMGSASVKVAQKLNEIMTTLYQDKNVPDIEFCVMGIGDVAYDTSPIQISQFESDIRIAEQLDKIYFEGCGGGNDFESYTAAWYMGVNHCKLDCWERGKKGVIITLGDELPNPYLPKLMGVHLHGTPLQADVKTSNLLEETKEKFYIHHLSINDIHSSYRRNQERYDVDGNWKKLIGEDNYKVSTLDTLANDIIDIIKNHISSTDVAPIKAEAMVKLNENAEVSW